MQLQIVLLHVRTYSTPNCYLCLSPSPCKLGLTVFSNSSSGTECTEIVFERGFCRLIFKVFFVLLRHGAHEVELSFYSKRINKHFVAIKARIVCSASTNTS